MFDAIFALRAAIYKNDEEGGMPKATCKFVTSVGDRQKKRL